MEFISIIKIISMNRQGTKNAKIFLNHRESDFHARRRRQTIQCYKDSPASQKTHFIIFWLKRSGLTDWLSGSGGIGETHIILAPLLENRASFERRNRCPTGAGVSPNTV
jgi:hypothetical protein